MRSRGVDIVLRWDRGLNVSECPSTFIPFSLLKPDQARVSPFDNSG